MNVVSLITVFYSSLHSYLLFSPIVPTQISTVRPSLLGGGGTSDLNRRAGTVSCQIQVRWYNLLHIDELGKRVGVR